MFIVAFARLCHVGCSLWWLVCVLTMTSTSCGEKILSLINIGINNTSSKCPSTSIQVPVYQINNDIDHEEIILQHDSSEQVNELQEYESRIVTELRPVVDTCTTKAIADNIECEQQNPIATREVEDGISYYGCTYDVNDLQEYESQMFTELREYDVIDTCITTEIADNLEYEQQQKAISTAEIEDNIELEYEKQHSLIEKQKKRQLKRGTIHVPIASG